MSRRVQVPRLLLPIQNAGLEELTARVNETGRMLSFTARFDIQLDSEIDAERGQSERFTTAVGRLILARPKKVFLQIQAPVVKTNFAEFASDGDRFQLLVYPERYRVMLVGTNTRSYSVSQPAAERDERLRMAGALANIRPQHFTETLLFDLLARDAESDVLIQEERQVEEAVPPGGSSRERLIRSYYVLSYILRSGQGAWRLSSRFWFDRNNGLTLVRRQIYHEDGRLVQDIGYSNYWRENRTGLLLPASITFSRPYDQYRAHLLLNSSSAAVNNEFPATAFMLSKPSEWGDEVQVIDLDRSSR
ncbi:MAG: hypothetical protein HY650_07330 [Acidobacteria bacterium]|nr:hypothetical protein [Acidobacteriota bacterium]